MKVRELQQLLDRFDGESELAVNVNFPDIDYAVKTYDFAWGYDSDYDDDDGFQLDVTMHGTDFYYPAILKKVKDAVALIPEESCR